MALAGRRRLTKRESAAIERELGDEGGGDTG